jgi:hypothetical protein
VLGGYPCLEVIFSDLHAGGRGLEELQSLREEPTTSKK